MRRGLRPPSVPSTNRPGEGNGTMLGRAGLITIGAALAVVAPAQAITSIGDLGTLGAAGVRYDGDAAFDLNGDTATAIGDFDGDGIGDVAMGGRAADPSGRASAGTVFVVYGTTDLADVPDLGSPPAGVRVRRIDGAAPGDHAGRSVAAGDVTGDGKDDLVIGAEGTDPGGRGQAGTAYVVPGSSSSADIPSLDSEPGVVRFDGGVPGARFGVDVGAGDVTGDAKDDIVVGAFDEGVYVIPGGASLAGDTDMATLPPGAARFGLASPAGSFLGWKVTAGDVTGDARPDVIFTAPQTTTSAGALAGSVFVVPGAAALASDADLGTLPPGAARVDGDWFSDALGAGIGTGDVTGDAKPDLLIGAQFAWTPAKSARTGALYVLPGSAALPSVADIGTLPAGATRVAGAAGGDDLGFSVDAGDLVGDQKEEVVVGATAFDGAGRENAGAEYLIPASALGGGPVDLAAPPAGVLRWDGDEPGDGTGTDTSVGDADGDGREDAVFSAWNGDPGGREAAGSVYVIFGDAPTASLVATPAAVEAGDPVTWTASATVPGGGPLDFRFDIDGSPGYETAFGPTTSRTRTYLAPATITGHVEVRDQFGATDTASDTVTVTLGEGAASCSGVPISVGTSGPDTYSGGYGRQAYLGLGGADDIGGGYGDDCLLGNAGRDTVDGGYENDYVSGGAGVDVLKGGYGNDLLNAEDGAPGDTVNCGAGIDVARVDPGDSVSGCETTS